MLLIALALAPGLAITFYIYYQDKYDREPLSHVLLSFLLGMIAVVPVFFIESYFFPRIEKWIEINPIFYHFLLSFLVIGCTEEGMKYLATRTYAYRQKEFNEPFDGITYCVIVSMGFATLENLAYVLQHGFLTGLMRMFISVPAHACFGVLMGYHLGLAKIDRARQWTHKFRALLYPVILHGMFDFFLFLQGSGYMTSSIGDILLIIGSIASLYIGIKLSLRAIGLHKELSKQQFPVENNS